MAIVIVSSGDCGQDAFQVLDTVPGAQYVSVEGRLSSGEGANARPNPEEGLTRQAFLSFQILSHRNPMGTTFLLPVCPERLSIFP